MTFSRKKEKVLTHCEEEPRVRQVSTVFPAKSVTQVSRTCNGRRPKQVCTKLPNYEHQYLDFLENHLVKNIKGCPIRSLDFSKTERNTASWDPIIFNHKRHKCLKTSVFYIWRHFLTSLLASNDSNGIMKSLDFLSILWKYGISTLHHSNDDTNRNKDRMQYDVMFYMTSRCSDDVTIFIF